MVQFAIKEIFKTYKADIFKKRVSALNGLTLDIRTGEVFGLIGPNGAGKSSTIRLLLGLAEPDSGTILFRDQPVRRNVAPKEIGYLPENPYLYDHLTLREVLDFCGRVSGLSPSDVTRRRDELLSKLNMTGAQNRPLRTFSKGMLQRAGICFALLHDPEVVILDEPMSGLDPIGRKLVFDIVMELKERGKTVFFCSHILSDVERLCDRIGLLHRGRLIRMFERKDFDEESGFTVHLSVGTLNEVQRDVLIRNGLRVQKERTGDVVSVDGARLSEATGMMAHLGVKVTGSRRERVSLEELFISAIQGDNP